MAPFVSLNSCTLWFFFDGTVRERDAHVIVAT